MRRILIRTLGSLLMVILLIGIAFGVFSLIYFSTEPDTVAFPLGIIAKQAEIAKQVKIGRLVPGSADHYDVILVLSDKAGYYAYLPKAQRFWELIKSFLTTGSMGYTDAGDPVNPLLINQLSLDYPFILISSGVGFIGGYIASLFKDKRFYLGNLIAILALLTYAVVNYYSFKEIYSFVITLALALCLLSGLLINGKHPAIRLFMMLFIAISMGIISLNAFGLSGINYGFSSILLESYTEQGSALKAFAGFFMAVGLLAGPFLAGILHIYSRNRD